MAPPDSRRRVAVLAAGRKTGAVVAHALCAEGFAVRAIVRDAARATEAPAEAELVVAPDAPAQAEACQGADSVVSCAPAEVSVALLSALSPPLPHLVLFGSTRRWTTWPDHRAATVIALEHAFAALGSPGVLLYPTMIYGAGGENNVRRIAALARLGIVPLPKGGRSLIQPVHTDDVARAAVAAVARRVRHPEPIVLAGPHPLPYAAFVRAVAAAAGRRVAILPVPLWLAFALGAILSAVPGLPRVRRAEIRRLVEDKTFDISRARDLLGFDPIPLEEGLARTFGRVDMR
ncbi:MAG: NAD(P)H-binding protein [Elioraea sp.]|nr:NAD(P)H-binding protein [Elioraea sp.]MDW8445488.1 NAD(P)H-binding protein [Acetobacteraceae bacterium]